MANCRVGKGEFHSKPPTEPNVKVSFHCIPLGMLLLQPFVL
jgi:hypothetical protein